jgi:hypothetical protein
MAWASAYDSDKSANNDNAPDQAGKMNNPQHAARQRGSERREQQARKNQNRERKREKEKERERE